MLRSCVSVAALLILLAGCGGQTTTVLTPAPTRPSAPAHSQTPAPALTTYTFGKLGVTVSYDAKKLRPSFAPGEPPRAHSYEVWFVSKVGPQRSSFPSSPDNVLVRVQRPADPTIEAFPDLTTSGPGGDVHWSRTTLNGMRGDSYENSAAGSHELGYHFERDDTEVTIYAFARDKTKAAIWPSMESLVHSLRVAHHPLTSVRAQLAKVLAAIGPTVPLPPTNPTNVAKVSYTPGFELGIRYTSGVMLHVVPGSDDLRKLLATLMHSAPFSDERQHIRLTTVAGREVLTIAGGMQTGGGGRVPTSVDWNQEGCNYVLFSPVTDVSPQATATALNDLFRIIAETK